ncbi:MAG: F0F1 ATP synthase subunit epsilon [Deltaproteobacteria bacterium]|nr:F0F1 ATP synthase subunit epsilon [Deltaproteobacteria bacterium]
MKLSVLLPAKVFLEEDAAKVVAEGGGGYFCLEPAHIDMVTALVPGIFSFIRQGTGQEIFLAVDEGVLVKTGDTVLVSVRNAMMGPDLPSLKQTVKREFSLEDERAKKARSATAKIEAGFIRRFLEIQKHGA